MNESVDAQQEVNPYSGAGNSQEGRTSLPRVNPPSRAVSAMQWIVLVGLAVLSYFVFSRLGFQVVEVVGDSMQPTLRQSDHYLLKKWVYLFREPRPLEVVVIVDPQDTGFSVKRIIAREGDIVEFKQGEVFLNGVRLEEPYLGKGVATRTTAGTRGQMFVVGPDEYFVLGDNREVSVDSRAYGPVPRRNVLGLITP
jgi:signal peptidase I